MDVSARRRHPESAQAVALVVSLRAAALPGRGASGVKTSPNRLRIRSGEVENNRKIRGVCVEVSSVRNCERKSVIKLRKVKNVESLDTVSHKSGRNRTVEKEMRHVVCRKWPVILDNEKSDKILRKRVCKLLCR